MNPEEQETRDGQPEQVKQDARIQSPHNRFVLGYYGNPENARGLLDVQLSDELKALVSGSLKVVRNYRFETPF